MTSQGNTTHPRQPKELYVHAFFRHPQLWLLLSGYWSHSPRDPALCGFEQGPAGGFIEILPLAVGWYLMWVSAVAEFPGSSDITLSAQLPRGPPWQNRNSATVNMIYKVENRFMAWRTWHAISHMFNRCSALASPAWIVGSVRLLHYEAKRSFSSKFFTFLYASLTGER